MKQELTLESKREGARIQLDETITYLDCPTKLFYFRCRTYSLRLHLVGEELQTYCNVQGC